MSSPRPQDPYGSQQPSQGSPAQPGQPSYGGEPAPAQPAAEPYPGFTDVHADHYRRQEQAAQQRTVGPSGSANPLQNLRNWGMPPAAPGLDVHQQAMYDNMRRQSKRKFLQLAWLLALLLGLGLVSLIGRLV